MSTEQNTFELLARHLIAAFRPLAAMSSPGPYRQLMARLGFHVDAPPPSMLSLSGNVGSASVKVDVTAEGLPIKQALDLLLLVKGIFDAIQNLKNNPPPELNAQDRSSFVNEIGSSLVDLMIGDYIATAFPVAFNTLSILNVFAIASIPSTATRPAAFRPRINWPEIPKILGSASDLPRRTYKWGAPDFSVSLFLYHLSSLFAGLQFPVAMRLPDEELLAGYLGQPDFRIFDLPPLSLEIPIVEGHIKSEQFRAVLGIHALPAVGSALPGIISNRRYPPVCRSRFKYIRT